VTSGTAQLCARCAAQYQRSVALRAVGNRVATAAFVALLAGGVLFAVVSYFFAALMGAVLAPVGAVAGLLALAAFIVGLVLLSAGMLLRRPATRFLRS
jgi:hypothetical protein